MSKICSLRKMKVTECTIDGCNHGGQIRRGYCTLHYNRWLTHGDPNIVKQRGPSTGIGGRKEERAIALFWSKIKKGEPDECWEWQGYCNPAGYGKRGTSPGDRKWAFAHRLAYFLTYDIDPGDLYVCHRCDNPPCCNPSHLFLGTGADNARDRHEKGRSNRWLNRDHPSKKLFPPLISTINVLWKAGMPTKEIASQLNISQSCVYVGIKKGEVL